MPPIDKEELLATVSSAVDNEGPPTPPSEESGVPDPASEGESTPDGDEGGTDETPPPDGDTPPNEGDTPPGEGETPPEGEGDVPGADEEPPAGQMRGPDGRFVAKPRVGEPAAPAVPPADAAPPAERDPINDPIPTGLRKETGERMQTLIKIAKEQTHRADSTTQQFNEVMGLIQETRATPQQYGVTLDFLRMVNSGDPAQLEKALTVAQQTVANIAQMLGKPVAGVSFLSQHRDLQEAVQQGQMTEQYAEELAAARARQHLTTQTSRQQNEQQQREQQAQQARQGGISALNALEVELAQQDPQFAVKRPLLLEIMQPVINRLPPEQWAAAVKDVYSRIRAPAPVRTTPKPTVPVDQPFRGKNPAGGQQTAPKTLAEAIAMGVAQAGG